jgi:hypothetical protein
MRRTADGVVVRYRFEVQPLAGIGDHIGDAADADGLPALFLPSSVPRAWPGPEEETGPPEMILWPAGGL